MLTTDTIDTAGIANLLGVSVRTVRDRYVHAPTFPRPALAPTPAKRRWRVSDVLAWATPAGEQCPPPTHGSTSTAATAGQDAR